MIKTKTHKRTKYPKTKIPKKVKSYVKKAIDRKAEPEVVDSTTATTAFPNTNTMLTHLCNGTTQGDALGNRDANEIRMKYLELDIGMTTVHTDASNWAGRLPFTYRLMVVEDKQPNGAVFAVGDILSNTTYTTISPKTFVNRKRFKFLYDKLVKFNPTENTGVDYWTNTESTFTQTKRLRVKLKDTKVTYNGNAGTVADIVKNSLYAVVIATYVNAENKDKPPQVTIISRLHFYD